MQEQHASTPMTASGSHEPLGSSKSRRRDLSSESSSVEDWILDPAAHSDPPPSDDSDPRSTSEGSSSQWTESGSGERRPNPKLIKTRAESRPVSISSETTPSDEPVVDYKYRVYSKQLGHLFGLCDAVPYLLGPRSYLKAIVAFGNYAVPIEAYQDQEGNFVINPHKMTLLDKVLLMMLWLLRTSVDRRPANWEDLYSGMSVQKDRLVVYKDIGFGREPKLELMHFDDFIEMALAWKHLSNPALVAEDRPDVVTPWAVAAQMIREKDIPLEDIDKALYTELVGMTESQLGVRLTRLSATNELEKRKKEIAENARKLKSTNTFTYIMPQETNPDVMYAKRFSHQHPNGYLLDTTMPGHDDLLFPEARMRQDAEDLRKERKVRKDDKKATKARQKAKRRCKLFCLWALAFSVIVGLAVAIMLLYYFKKGDGESNVPQA